MLFTIIKKEVVSHVLSLRFAATFVLFVVLVFASIYVTVNEHIRQVDEYESLTRESKKSLDEVLADEEVDSAVNRLAWWDGRRDAVPVPPTAWLCQGVRGAYPSAIVTKSDGTSRRIERGSSPGAAKLSMRVPDYVYVVSVVLSLLAILFLFDGICGEKESGTLRLMLTNAVPRASILLGKWIGGYVVLIVPFLLATTGAIVYAWTKGVMHGDQLSRIAFLVFVACLYIAVFFNISLFVSTTTSRSATSLLICLLVWVLAVLAVPNMAPVTAKILAPTPSPEKINAEKMAVQREIDLMISRLTLTSGELSYGQKIENEQADLQRESERRKRRWDQYYDERRRTQAGLAAALGRISPSTAWTYAAASITDTGFAAFERFHAAQRRLGEGMETFWTRADQARKKNGAFTRPQAGDLPQLAIVTLDTAAAVEASLVDVLILVIMNVVFFMLAFAFFIKYDAR